MSSAVAPITNPPPGVKTICDRTAKFIASSGDEYEDKIRKQEAGNDKFAFLDPKSPYHAYYAFRLEQARRALRKDAPAQEIVLSSEARQLQETLQAAVTTQEAMEAEAAAAFTVPEPPPNHFLLTQAPALTAKDLDVIKLMARFVAVHGAKFMETIAAREQGNALMGFLRPSHSLHPVFLQFIDQYKRVIDLPDSDRQRLAKAASSKAAVVGAATAKYEYVRYKRTKDKKELPESRVAGLAPAARIDWHDFVIVSTVTPADIDPSAHDGAELVVLTSARNRTRAGGAPIPALARAAQTVLPAGVPAGFVDGAVEDDNDDADMDMSDDDESAAVAPAPAPAPVPAPTPAPAVAAPKPAPPPAGVKIVKNYEPKVLDAASRVAAAKTAICELCGQSVPLDDFEEHRRIELLDPKWAKHRAAEEAARKTTALAQGPAISGHLKRLAQARSDIFVSSGDGSGNNESGDAKPAPIIWDGDKSTAKAAKAAARKRAAEQQRASASNGSAPQQGQVIGPRPAAASRPLQLPPPQQQPHHQPRMPPQYPGHPGQGYRPPSGYPMAGAGGPYPPQMHVQGGPGKPGGPPFHPSNPSNPPHPGYGMLQPGSAPLAKRQKTMGGSAAGAGAARASATGGGGGGLQPEAQFAVAHPGKVAVAVHVPSEAAHAKFGFNGQVVTIELDVRDTIADLKPKLSAALNGMPLSKMAFATGTIASLSNNKSLAYYNITSATPVHLSFKGRGKRKR
ncbi:pre-mRNA-splicing factor sap114 [Thecamonas trahens ATCC 50062]|uniref:Pre-mRNA-splicing factor sap114 n=1 Tax=Thecamonas trahens ATCC 50062 TaxID=461836 RepID=A0A0L0DRP6_THETB|nr:pre-mRNA-splicing factor sap114 [Thecamonas trahens ATCC 50062]KNC54927.1 pre-mRNA-splicing factor sap114 [Thecamonas trahens ATCC 50062]|eukprot:XP_013753515.1 pre-mRNA-splicing factor sap114 [Thecamonas trahens ATCC 50062]